MKLLFLLIIFSVGVQVNKAKLQQKIAPYKEKKHVDTFPERQNIPLDESLAHLRPPKPIIPATKSIFIGLSVFRDGYRCGKTVFTGFKRANRPELIHFGIVDQVLSSDLKCKVEYCKMAAKEWPNHPGGCKYSDQIVIDEHKADDSRGPTLARHQQQKLVGPKDEFCLQLDGHSIFTNGWDDFLINDWLQADNEMAVLSTYLHHIHDFVRPDGSNRHPSQLPHLCKTIRGARGLVRNEGASMIINPQLPQMTALWGAGLSFSKCHAERRVLIDSHTLWMFDGEEFLRSSHLWTYGYDLYSPSKMGAVVYHNYSKVPARFEYVKVDGKQKEAEGVMAANRFRLLVDMPFKGPVDTFELKKYGFGTVRTFQQYLNFSGVTFAPNKKDKDSCRQLHWVPYTDPKPIEDLNPGYHLYPPATQEVRVERMQKKQEEDGAHNGGDVVRSEHRRKLRKNVKRQEQELFAKKERQSTIMSSNLFGFFAVALLVFGVIVYSNENLWRRFVFRFRLKSNSVRR